ncbi:MAG: bifunctional nuclease family protein [Sandaracinaceae bacterium]|nr:bifunctional nuclease family protein [Sandaracinaceae bacterium]
MRSLALLLVLAGCGGACPPAPSAPAVVTAAPPRRPAPSPDPPPGSIVMQPMGVRPSGEGYVLVLADQSRQRMLPIVIGGTEAMTIELRLAGEQFERPLTHDLLDAMLARLGAEVVWVHIDKVRGGVFVGSVHVWDGRQLLRFDARTSDAVAIALGHDAPIFVAPSVLDEQAVEAGGVEDE